MDSLTMSTNRVLTPVARSRTARNVPNGTSALYPTGVCRNSALKQDRYTSTISLKWRRGLDHTLRAASNTRRAAQAARQLTMATAEEPNVILVTGATGRTGRHVVDQLLAIGKTVKAQTRDAAKAAEELEPREGLELVEVPELTDEAALLAACEGVDAVIWCAQGDGRPEKMQQKVGKGLGTLVRAAKMRLNLPVPVEGSAAADGWETPAGGLDACAAAMAEAGGCLVLLSSAAVTRSGWSEAKQQALELCVDIPIVRLNPFGVLESTRRAEERVRRSGARYSVVRPVGLRDSSGPKPWPRGRPILSQGDVAVGRANREDVASVLVQACLSPAAASKTFEMATLAGEAYPAPVEGLEAVFARLRDDSHRAAMDEDLGFGTGDPEGPGEAAVKAQFDLLMQLLPGEVQDATRLEMGRTYEELDKGKVNRAKGAAATDREIALAARGEQRGSS